MFALKFAVYLDIDGHIEILLVVGFYAEALGALSAACLGLLMFFGLIVRMRIRDPLLLWLPAFGLLLINLFLAVTLDR